VVWQVADPQTALVITALSFVGPPSALQQRVLHRTKCLSRR
jgi:hypothetical protein